MNELSRDFAAAGKVYDEEIGRYLVIERTAIARADVAIIFGNRHAFDPLAQEAARLYHQGYVPKIVASGGVREGMVRSEAQILQLKLLHLHVPLNAILVEDQAQNTAENIRFSRTLLAWDHEDPIESAILVGSAVAGRRFLMTMAREWPEVFAMASNVNPFPFPLTQWPAHPERQIVENEYAKIPEYLQAGFISEIDIPAINRRALLAQQEGPKL